MTIDDARENFMSDVYNTLDFLPTNNEANRIIDSFDRVTSGLNQQPCEDWYDVPSDEMTLEQARQAVKDLRKKLAEYLEQNPCEDVPDTNVGDIISRQAVLEVLKNNRYRFNISQEGYCEGKVLWSENLIKDDARKEIEQLPSVTPKENTDWIPVSERLPEESKRYVVATKYNDVMTDFYTGEGFLGDGIIAWMPLPAPFEPQESEDTEVANDRKDCPYRQEENGNCLPVGGFCTSVADKYCKHLSEVSE